VVLVGPGAYYVRDLVAQDDGGQAPARWVKGIRRDRWIILAWIVATCGGAFAAGLVKYGSVAGAVWLPIKMFVVPFLGFSFVIGSVVHVHHIQPTIRWWTGKEWNKFRGQMEGTTILRVMPGLNFFFHWIMVHIPHHVDVRIPMYNPRPRPRPSRPPTPTRCTTSACASVTSSATRASASSTTSSRVTG
jgi:fatty acid desaturase